jgi:hypothetical protein
MGRERVWPLVAAPPGILAAAAKTFAFPDQNPGDSYVLQPSRVGWRNRTEALRHGIEFAL